MKVTSLTRTLSRKLRRVASKKASTAGAAILAGGMIFSGSPDASAIETLLSEDFEGLTLIDSTLADDGTAGDGSDDQMTDYTRDLPTGWTRDNTTTAASGGPGLGDVYFGFTALDKQFWINEAGQDRDSFTKGVGAVLVSDADQYDDFVDVGDNGLNVFAQTPAIDLSGILPGSVVLDFDSSFRPYDTMTALVDVSYDGGATYNNVLTLVPENSGGVSSLDRANEAVSLPLDNPDGADELLVRFGMTEAGNDWWWAIDNVNVTGRLVPEPTSLALMGLVASGYGLAASRRRD